MLLRNAHTCALLHTVGVLVCLQYLPDFKFWTADSSQRYAKARDYPERAMEAIKEMHRQAGLALPEAT
jgi:uncharacterized Fe-S radical SAM superfamily protein PflX